MKNILTRYGYLGALELLFCLMRTKLLYPKARLIRFPFDIRGRKFIEYGKGFTTGRGCRIEAYPFDDKSISIRIGENVQINDYVHITGVKNVFIGNNVLIASKVYITDSNHGNYSTSKEHSNPLSIPKNRPLFSKEVIIEDCVWLGEAVTVLPGVVIGKGSIIGANSVVTKNITPYTITAGNPARVIKKFKFQTAKWEKICETK